MTARKHLDHHEPAVQELIDRARAEERERIRLVADSMADHARRAWRSASAPLSDREALVQHADAMSRWSERIYMALSGRLQGDEEWLTAARIARAEDGAA